MNRSQCPLGAVAKCVLGHTGLITGMRKNSPDVLPYYVGLCLDFERIGKLWQSVDPEIIAYTIDDWVKIRFEELKQESKK